MTNATKSSETPSARALSSAPVPSAPQGCPQDRNTLLGTLAVLKGAGRVWGPSREVLELVRHAATQPNTQKRNSLERS